MSGLIIPRLLGGSELATSLAMKGRGEAEAVDWAKDATVLDSGGDCVAIWLTRHRRISPTLWVSSAFSARQTLVTSASQASKTGRP